MQRRRENSTSDNNNTYNDYGDDMSESIPKTISGSADYLNNDNNSIAWDTSSMMSSSTFGTAGLMLSSSGGTSHKKNDDANIFGDSNRSVTSASARSRGDNLTVGSTSLLFSGLTNIDENAPLRNTGGAGARNKNNTNTQTTTTTSNAFQRNSSSNSSVLSSGVMSKSGHSTARSARSTRSNGNFSVFTEKRQEDIDQLFEDLLGKSNNTSDTVSIASTAMSSIMPIQLRPSAAASASVSGGGTTGINRRSASTAHHQSHSSGDAYSSNQYIFNENGSQGNDKKSQHDLIYGNAKDDYDKHGGRNKSSMIAAKFAKFYNTRKDRMLHVRAGLVLMVLVSIMFVAVQFSVFSAQNRESMQKIRNQHRVEQSVRGYNSGYNGEHDEMVDRPNSHLALGGQKQMNKMTDSAIAGARTMPESARASLVVNGGMDINPQAGGATNSGPTDPLTDSNAGGSGNALTQEKDLKELPPSFQNLVDLTSGGMPPHNQDIPFFWQVPRAGTGTLREILSECMGIVLAAEPGGKGPFAGDPSLEVIQDGKGFFVNVDPTYLGGIERAKKLDLVSSFKADVIISPYVHELSTIFTPEHQGRMFAFIRHPIERCASQYAYKKTVDPEIAQMSLLDYARSGRVENNWMTRFLANQLTGEVTFEHLVKAKEILRTKCLVGLHEFLWASVKRFEMYYGWSYTNDPKAQYDCRRDKLTENTDATKFEQPVVKEGTQEWTMLLWQNKFDMKLYNYAQELFKEQVSLFPAGTAPK